MASRLVVLSGPTASGKTALGVLSVLSVRDLALAIVTGDVKAIKSAPGIGPKTAQRILLELKDKVSDEELVGQYAVSGSVPAAVVAGEGAAVSDALAALMALGYTQGEAAGAVNKVKDQAETAEDLIRLALRAMSQM